MEVLNEISEKDKLEVEIFSLREFCNKRSNSISPNATQDERRQCLKEKEALKCDQRIARRILKDKEEALSNLVNSK